MLIALAIIRHPTEDAILIARRKTDAHLGGLWEFPGGKCEPGEAPADCAVREALEEVGLAVTIEEEWPIVEHTYPTRHVELHPFVCRAESTEARALGSDEVRWVKIEDLGEYAFPEVNGAWIERLRSQRQ
jgi:mutator protein MutT